MIREPQFPSFTEPSTPNWPRWWLVLLVLWSVQAVALLTLWPADVDRIHLWVLSTVMPLCWGLAAGVRMLVWHLRAYAIWVHEDVQRGALQGWWQRRALRLPVQDVLLIGPAGLAQEHYLALMAKVPTPPLRGDPGKLRFPLSGAVTDKRGPLLAAYLAEQTRALPGLVESWSHVRALCWAGDAASEAAFVQTLANHGLVLPKARLPVQNVADLDELINGFNQHCDRPEDWLLCAGVVSMQASEGEGIPGEGGFLWRVGHQAKAFLHRGDVLLPENGELPAELCAQVQRYARLSAPPPDCLALDESSSEAFVTGGWSAREHQLSDKWGELAHLGPFIGMSLALLQAAHAGQGCGWISKDTTGKFAMGVAMPYGKQ
jgi:hypothetical protein